MSTVQALMRRIGQAAVAAAAPLAFADTAAKDRALLGGAAAVRAHGAAILEANAQGLREGRASGLGAPLLQRRGPDAGRVGGTRRGLAEIAQHAGPVGSTS